MGLDKVVQFDNGAKLATTQNYAINQPGNGEIDYMDTNEGRIFVESNPGWFGARKTKIYNGTTNTYDIWESGWFNLGGAKKTSSSQPWTPQNSGESIF